MWFSVDLATSAEENTALDVIFISSLGNYFPRINTTSPGTGQPQHWYFNGGLPFGPEITPNAPTLLVAEVHRDDADYVTFKCWVNPSPVTDSTGRPAEAPTVTQTGFWGAWYYTFTQTQIVARLGQQQFDEIRIGTTYADVNYLEVAPVAVADTAVILWKNLR